MARKIIASAISEKDYSRLNQLSWGMVDPERKLERRDLANAMYAATVACNMTDYKDAAILDTLARTHFLSGGLARAIELQKLAVENSEGGMKESLEKALKEYEAAGSQ